MRVKDLKRKAITALIQATYKALEFKHTDRTTCIRKH